MLQALLLNMGSDIRKLIIAHSNFEEDREYVPASAMESGGKK
jgi:hypothetical protein